MAAQCDHLSGSLNLFQDNKLLVNGHPPFPGAYVCALNGKCNSLKKEFPEGESPLYAGVTSRSTCTERSRSISKSQGGLG